MTRIVEVTQKEMERRTGIPYALGYAKPRNSLILIRKGLDSKTRKEVIRHESDHIMNDEEGPFFGSLLGLLGFGGSVVSGLSAMGAAGTAAAESRAAREQARSDLAPWRQTGEQAKNYLWDLMTGKSSMSDALSKDANYKFRVGEGEQGQLNYGKATGMRLSGRALKAMERFRQGLASQEGNNYLNRLFNISNQGQSAAAGQANASTSAAGQINNATTMGYQGLNNAVQGGISNYIALMQQNKLLNALGAG